MPSTTPAQVRWIPSTPPPLSSPLPTARATGLLRPMATSRATGTLRTTAPRSGSGSTVPLPRGPVGREGHRNPKHAAPARGSPHSGVEIHRVGDVRVVLDDSHRAVVRVHASKL